ncbi:hypothetical protein [Haladaptatus sp. DYF46]|uniref:hypothetical protein n=1 Tax=unclassified Haladaptatus TaxID=2622732 RepID=UPI001E3072F6|nr:hypothetical protein [Haladaptatus sp. DYF46]
MVCPYLDYRNGGNEPTDQANATERVFDEPRAFCTVAGEFVQPMRADICNDRYGLEHDRHCEIYRGHDAGGEDE